MNSRILSCIAFFLLFTVVFSSCKKTESEPNYPVKISYEEFSLEGTGCQWTNLPYAHKVIVINSSEELGKYMSCEEDFFPEIDFSKSTLLLASGKASIGILEPVVTDLKQYSLNKYRLDIDIILSDTATQKSWIVAFLVKKMKEDSKVKLNEICKEQEIDYPVDLPFLEYLLESKECRWSPFGSSFTAEYVIINSKTRLENFIYCDNESSYPEIDFSKYSLILVTGSIFPSGGKFETDLKSFQLIDKQNYVVNIRVKTLATGGLKSWYVPILVHKIGENAPIEIIVENV